MKKLSGFTLMETIVALAIVAILATAAIISYDNAIKQSRRTDAMQTLIAMQLAEEKYRLNNANYGNLAAVWNNVTTSNLGYYTLNVTNVSATSYTLSATAISSQQGDTEDGTACSPMTLTFNNGVTTKSPAACWTD